MDLFLLIISGVFILLGIIGCIVPALPGPPLSWIGILLLHFTSYVDFSSVFLVSSLIATVVITILDYVIPIYSTKLTGGTKWGMRGCAIGLLVGLFYGIVGVFVCPFIGALVGELLYQFIKVKDNSKPKQIGKSILAALGSFVGLLFGIVAKLVISCFFAFIFIKEIITSVL